MATSAIHESIRSLDLTPLRRKLMDPVEGEGWTLDDCEKAELEYRRFLTLMLVYPDKAIVPTPTMDTVWHYHILDTRKYHCDTERIFGRYLHHYPYFGMNGADDERALQNAFDETARLYELRFGVSCRTEPTGCSSCRSCRSCRNCASLVPTAVPTQGA